MTILRSQAYDLVHKFYIQLIDYKFDEDRHRYGQKNLNKARQCALVHLEATGQADSELAGEISDNKNWI